MHNQPHSPPTPITPQVYAATFKGQRVAVKNLLTMQVHGSTDDMLTRLESLVAEVKSLKRCNHANIVHCCMYYALCVHMPVSLCVHACFIVSTRLLYRTRCCVLFYVLCT